MRKECNKVGSFIVGLSLLSLPLIAVSQVGITTKNNPNKVNQGTKVFDNVDDASKAREMRQMDQASFSQSVRDEISSVLANTVVAAADGDMDEVINNFAKSSRERLESDSDMDTAQLENRSESFQTAWDKSSPDSSFEDVVSDKLGNLEIVSGDPAKNAVVRLTGTSSNVELKLTNEGLIGDAWKIEAPTTLTRQQLQTQLEQVLRDNSTGNDSRKVAAEILKAMSGPQQIAQKN